MFIYIGIGLLVLSLVSLYLIMAVVRVQKATYAVIDKWGTKPIKVLLPGWHFIPWPAQTLHARISGEAIIYNVEPKFTMLCLVDNGLAAATLTITGRKKGIAKLTSAEVSLAWKFDFSTDPDKQKLQLIAYYDQTSPDEEAWLQAHTKTSQQSADMANKPRIVERIRDIIQELFREATSKMKIYAAMNPKPEVTKEIQRRLQFLCAGPSTDKEKAEFEKLFGDTRKPLDLPIRIIQLSINSPFEPEPAIANAIELRVANDLTAEANVVKAQGDLLVETVNVDIRKKKAEAEKIAIELEAQARGFDKLSPEAKAEALLKLDALRVYAQVAAGPSAKIIIGADFMKEVSAVVGAFTKGGKA